MRRCLHVAAPLVASTALGLLTGCQQPGSQCVDNETGRVVNTSLCTDSAGRPRDNHSVHLASGTRRGGFGSSFAGNLVPVVLGSAAAALIIGFGG